LNKQKVYVCQPLNVLDIKYVRQTEMHTDEFLVPESGSLDVKIVIEWLKR